MYCDTFAVFIDVATGLFAAPYSASVGALSDSFYETLLKQWIAEGKQSDSPLLRAWRAAWQGIRDRSVTGFVFCVLCRALTVCVE